MQQFLLLLLLLCSVTAFAQNVGVGTVTPVSKLAVKGGLAIGNSYSENNAAPTDGLLVEGNVGIGTTTPRGTLHVANNLVLGSGNGALRKYASSISGNPGANVFCKMGELTPASASNVIITGKVYVQTTAALGETEFSIVIRGQSSVNYWQTQTSSGRTVTLRVYQDPAITGRLIVGFVSNSTLHNFGWDITILERAQTWNYWQNESAMTTLDATALSAYTLLTPATANDLVLNSDGSGSIRLGSSNYATAGFLKTSSNGTLSVDATVNLVSSVSGVLPIANGGTGSSSQVWVDLTNTQTAAGAKTWSNVATFVSGIRSSNGTVSAPSFSFTGDTDIGMYRIGTNALGFSTGGSERMRIISNGAVGINTGGANPRGTLDVIGNAYFAAAAATGGGIPTGTSPADGATIDGNAGKLSLQRSGAGNPSLAVTSPTATGTMDMVVFYRAGNIVGGITTTPSTTSYLTTSDRRLKENIVPRAGALADIQKINVYNYNFTADPGKEKFDGFMAQEVKEIVPYVVSGDENRKDEYGNMMPLMVDYSKLVPLLTKAVQEQQAEIAELKKRSALTEAAVGIARKLLAQASAWTQNLGKRPLHAQALAR